MRDPFNGITTKKGRVVYDRRRNPFSVSDVQRISKKLPIQQYEATTDRFNQILEVVRSGELPGFALEVHGGSGSFGGAGATRSFSGSEIGRIVLIMEEK